MPKLGTSGSVRGALRNERTYRDIHILRLSKVRWAPLVTAIQRALRKGTNEGLTISYDSSSPYRTGGVSVKYAFLNSFGRSLKNDWTIKTFKFPVGYGYANITKRMPLAQIHDGHLNAPLFSPIAKLLSIQDMNIRKGDMDIRTIDAFADEVLTNHNVYVYCLATIMANEHVFDEKPTAPQKMMDAVGIIDELFVVDDWNTLLNKKRDFLHTVAGS